MIPVRSTLRPSAAQPAAVGHRPLQPALRVLHAGGRTTSGCRARTCCTSRRSARWSTSSSSSASTSVRLTGGEPLLRRDLPALVAMLAAKPGLDDLALTTNGILLADQIDALQRRRARPHHRQPRHAAPRSLRRADALRRARRGVREGIDAAHSRVRRASRSTPSSSAASTTTSWSI